MAVSDLAGGLYEAMWAQKNHAWSQSELEGLLDPLHKSSLVDFIQELINQQRVKVLQSDSGLRYEAIAEDEAAQIRGMTSDEAIVYSYVQSAGREGIWTKTIRLRSNLHQHVVNRCLKQLETKRFIKTVKNVKFPTRKIVMLYSLQPSIDVTGGPWFTDTELDSEFIALLLRLVWQYIAHQTFPGAMDAPRPQMSHLPGYSGYPSLDDIHEFVVNSGVSTVELGLSDIASLCQVLVYDGKIESFSKDSKTERYRATWPGILAEQGRGNRRVPILPPAF